MYTNAWTLDYYNHRGTCFLSLFGLFRFRLILSVFSLAVSEYLHLPTQGLHLCNTWKPLLLIFPGLQVPSQCMQISKMEAISISTKMHLNKWKCCITTALPASRLIFQLKCCPEGHLNMFVCSNAPRSSQRGYNKTTTASTLGSEPPPPTEVGKGLPKVPTGSACGVLCALLLGNPSPVAVLLTEGHSQALCSRLWPVGLGWPKPLHFWLLSLYFSPFPPPTRCPPAPTQSWIIFTLRPEFCEGGGKCVNFC